MNRATKLVLVAAIGFAAAGYFSYLSVAWPRGAATSGRPGGSAWAQTATLARCAEYIGMSEFGYENCIQQQAVQQRDQGVCEILAGYWAGDDYLQSCRSAVAAAAGDVALCQTVSESRRDSCVAGVAAATRSFELCRSLESNAAQRCFLATALATHDPASCDSYATELGHERLYCAVRLGVKLNDARACASLPDQFQRDHCYYLSAIALRQPSLCAQVVNEYLPPVAGSCGETNCFSAGECYAQLAALTGDGELCASVGEGLIAMRQDDARSDCLVGVASSTGQARWCEQLPASVPGYQRSRCLMRAAQQSGDVAVCSSIEDGNEQADCYRRVPGPSTTKADCDRIPAGFGRAVCYAIVAIEHRQPELCSQLPPPGQDYIDWADSCRAWVENPGSIDR